MTGTQNISLDALIGNEEKHKRSSPLICLSPHPVKGNLEVTGAEEAGLVTFSLDYLGSI